MLLGILAIAAILLGVPAILYCMATLSTPETPAQRRKRDRAHRDRLTAERAVRVANRRARRGMACAGAR